MFYNAYKDKTNFTFDDFEPVEMTTTDWNSNPRTRGAYSVYPVGAFKDDQDMKKFKAPLKSNGEDTLYFTGEAWAPFPATIHGAYMSGQATAK